MKAKVERWGSSLAVRLPAEITAGTTLRAGQNVDVVVQGSEVVISSVEPRLTAKEMFRGRSTEEWRAMYADHYEWGPDVGREIVDE